jgi:formate--tetrahydrofolate ligase
LKRIEEVADSVGLGPDHLEPHGRHVAKLSRPTIERLREQPRGQVILVSAITPTPAGEGKTTTSIGLAQGLKRRGESVVLALREPSLGPCMGMKGGATGGGKSSIHPEDRINLHFTGDMHAITSAHNLLAAMLDNHIHHGNALGLSLRRVTWGRVMDMNDRALRSVVVGLGGPGNGVTRQSGFDITAASEIMAMLCLAEDRDDLAARIDRTWVGFDEQFEPRTAKGLNATEGMMVLLKDALLPNLVQSTEGVPALVHGGPFANIAHGCNSVIATKTARGLADWVVTEAGFAFDLGGEKFFDIKCRSAGLDVAAVVLVATIRALKMHGGVALDDLRTPDPAAVARGLANLEQHVQSVRAFGKEPVVALNHFPTDADEELETVRQRCRELGLSMATGTYFSDGGAGAEGLADAVLEAARREPSPLNFLYPNEASAEQKIRSIARTVYGARDVSLSTAAHRKIELAAAQGLADLPICMAKTQSSLSDDPKRFGRPTDFDITVRDIEINPGAGFLVALTGEMMRMPGLPRIPRAESLRLDGDDIVGLMG